MITPRPAAPSRSPGTFSSEVAILSILLLGLAMTIAMAVVSVLNIARFGEEGRSVAHTHEVIDNLKSLLVTTRDVEASLRGYVVSGDETLLGPYEAAQKRMTAAAGKSVGLLRGHADQAQRIENLEHLLQQHLEAAGKITHWRRQGEPEAANAKIAESEADEIQEAIRQVVTEMMVAENELRERRLQRWAGSEQQTMTAVSVCSLLSALLAALALVLLHRDFSGRRRAYRALSNAESQLRSLLNTIPAGVCAADRATGRIVFANDFAGRMFGYGQEQLIGMPAADHIAAEEFDRIVRKLDRALAGEAALDQDIPLQCSDGRVFRAEIRNSQIELDGRACMLSVFTDVTERQQTAAALRESEERARRQLAELQAIYDSAPVGLCVLDTELRYVRINQRLAAINGLPAAEHLGKTPAEIIPSLAPKAVEIAERILRTGAGMTDIEFVGATRAEPSVQRTWIEQWLPLKDTEGRIIGINVVADDVTERKRAEELLRKTKERLEFAQQAALSGAWDWDLTTGHIEWSHELFALFGLDPQKDAAGFEAWRRVLHPADSALAEERIANALRDGTLLNSEYRIVLGDGSVRWICALGRTRYDPAGRAVRMAGLCMDITERKEAEEQRQWSEEILRFALESTRTGLWQWDPATGVLAVTPQNQRLFGLPEHVTEMASADFVALIHAGDLQRISEPFRKATQQGGYFDVEYRIRRPDGVERWIHSIGSPLTSRQGRQPFVGISRDITERKRAEAELLAADRRKDEFLATLAHELRNPLAPLCAALDVLRQSGSDEDSNVPRLREMMERQVNHLARLVDDLLEVSRITRGQIELRKERIDLAVVVGQALETSQPLIQTSGQALDVSLPPEPLVVEADPVRVAQVLSNLINNATKYSGKGGQIRVAAGRRGSEAVVSVGDDGVGIAAEDLAHVFDLFSRVGCSPGSAPNGLGIGLALARRLVEMHGGRIEARSEGRGRGSEFIVHLPLPAVGEIHTAMPEAPAPLLEVTSRVMVVDDNRDCADSLALLLEGLGAAVRVAYDGQGALEILTAFKPDVVLLDIGMPGMNGYELAQRIRHSPEGSELVLVAVTGWAEEKDQRRCRDAGFDHHLAKPVRLDLLRALMTELGSKARGAAPP